MCFDQCPVLIHLRLLTIIIIFGKRNNMQSIISRWWWIIRKIRKSITGTWGVSDSIWPLYRKINWGPQKLWLAQIETRIQLSPTPTAYLKNIRWPGLWQEFDFTDLTAYWLGMSHGVSSISQKGKVGLSQQWPWDNDFWLWPWSWPGSVMQSMK